MWQTKTLFDGAALIIASASLQHCYRHYGIRTRRHYDVERLKQHYDGVTEDCSQGERPDPQSVLPVIVHRFYTVSYNDFDADCTLSSPIYTQISAIL